MGKNKNRIRHLVPEAAPENEAVNGESVIAEAAPEKPKAELAPTEVVAEPAVARPQSLLRRETALAEPEKPARPTEKSYGGYYVVGLFALFVGFVLGMAVDNLRSPADLAKREGQAAMARASYEQDMLDLKAARNLKRLTMLHEAAKLCDEAALDHARRQGKVDAQRADSDAYGIYTIGDALKGQSEYLFDSHPLTWDRSWGSPALRSEGHTRMATLPGSTESSAEADVPGLVLPIVEGLPLSEAPAWPKEDAKEDAVKEDDPGSDL